MTSATEIRQRRMRAGIPVDLVSSRSGVDRCTVSLVERGLLSVPDEKMRQIASAVEELAAAKRLVQAYAISVGYPISAKI